MSKTKRSNNPFDKNLDTKDLNKFSNNQEDFDLRNNFDEESIQEDLLGAYYDDGRVLAKMDLPGMPGTEAGWTERFRTAFGYYVPENTKTEGMPNKKKQADLFSQTEMDNWDLVKLSLSLIFKAILLASLFFGIMMFVVWLWLY